MRLSAYLQQGSNFHDYDAYLPNGARITAHHGRDRSTERSYSRMKEGQFLVSYKFPSGSYCHAVIVDDVDVKCKPAE